MIEEMKIDECGTKRWYKNGKFHREDGPAIEFTSGYKGWYKNGKRHNIYGPAVLYSYGEEEYWVEGKQLSKEEFYSYDS